jgi:ParB-like chromosome segregation protein Spo0J
VHVLQGAVLYEARGVGVSLDLSDLERQPIVRLPIDLVCVSDSPRRSGEVKYHVRKLAEAQDELPPIIVHRETFRLIDGLHRLRALQMRGEKEVDVRFYDGDESASFVLAVQANVTHGLPLSLADRKAAATRIIRLYPAWSDRMIGSATGIAPKTVAQVRARAERELGRPAGHDPQLDGTLGRDGRVRPRDGKERRELVGRLLREDPKASLREIARKAGVSPETVRSVRARLDGPHQGQSPRDGPASPEPDASPSLPLPRVESVPGERSTRSAVDALRSDPAFRSSDSGRALLRLLGVEEVLRRRSGEVIKRIPPHCLGWVAEAAQECAKAWQDFAEEIDQHAYAKLLVKK